MMAREPMTPLAAGRRWPSAGGTLATCALACAVGAVAYPFAARMIERASRLARVDALVSRASARGGAHPYAAGAFPAALDPVEPELTSWGNVAGCGVSGGGGGGVRWIGRRAPRARGEVELLASRSAGADLTSDGLTLKVTGDIPGRFNLGVSLPYLSNSRHDENFEQLGYYYDLEAEGFGDVGLMVSRKFGLEGNTNVSFTLTFPTGEYAQEEKGYPLPYDAQLGTGVSTLSATAEYMRDHDWGPIIAGGGYTHNGGENDVGNLRGDSLQAYCYVGRKTEYTFHSFGASVTCALQKDKNQGNVIEEQSVMMVTLQYGLELSFGRVPVFMALTATLGEDSASNSTGLALGVVTSF